MIECIEITEILNRSSGDRIIYHRGYLPLDQGFHKNPRDRNQKERETQDTAELAFKLAVQGKIWLTQKRLGFLQYEYYATRGPVPASFVPDPPDKKIVRATKAVA